MIAQVRVPVVVQHDADTLAAWGEENRDWGGAFAVYRGLTEQLPYHRLFNSPISEGAIVGAGVGYALSGGRAVVERLQGGGFEGLVCMGTNPIVGGPDAGSIAAGLDGLKWMVAADLWETETSVFWRRPGVDPWCVRPTSRVRCTARCGSGRRDRTCPQPARRSRC